MRCILIAGDFLFFFLPKQDRSTHVHHDGEQEAPAAAAGQLTPSTDSADEATNFPAAAECSRLSAFAGIAGLSEPPAVPELCVEFCPNQLPTPDSTPTASRTAATAAAP